MKILKNKKLITVLAMLLMVATVVGMGTMTYSRYVTSKGMDAPESATAAKWGYVLEFDTSNLFGQAYENEVVVATSNDASLDVKYSGNDDAKIIAPGTSGSLVIKVSGVAEVLAKFSIAAEATDVTLYLDGEANPYRPIQWSLKTKVGSTETPVDIGGTSLEKLLAALPSQNLTVPAGSEIPETEYIISWSWAIGSETLNDPNNQKDTAIGMLAKGYTIAEIEAATGLNLDDAKSSQNVLGISLDVTATVMQVQADD